MNKEKLHKFALNQISEKSELEEVISWIEASPENREEFNTLKNLWAISGFANYDSYIQEDKIKTTKQQPKTISLLGLLKYAAIFILAFIIGGGAFSFLNYKSNSQLAYNNVIVPAGESAEVILPDSTHIWLNSGSKLVYPSVFSRKSRDVELSGEAFFEVAHKEKKKFNVITPELTVEVLGTSFNVEAFKQSNVVNVTLVEGKVNLKNNKGRILTGLLPGENAMLDLAKQQINIASVELTYFTSWKDGYLVFKDEKLIDIATKLERWFNVEVVFNEEAIKDIKFTGTILKNKPIDQILDILKYTSKIEYAIEMKNNKPSIIYFKSKPMK